jgi:transposase
MLGLADSSPAAPMPESDSQVVDEAPPAPPPRRYKRPTRKLIAGQLPAHLPRISVVSEPTQEDRCCEECGGDKKLIGTEQSEILEWVPGGFHVEVTERRKYACRGCQSGVVIGPPPVRVLDGALPGPGLLAELLCRKGNEHNPIERQSRIFTRRHGVPLSPSTLGDWYSRSLDLLESIHKRIGQLCQSRSHLSTDATPLPVLDRDDPRGIKRGQLWPVRSDSEVLFLYAPTGTGTLVSEFLGDFKGTLQTDGTSTVDKIFDRKNPSPPIRAGCLAHMRRRFFNAMEAGDGLAVFPMKLIRQIYDIERNASERALDAIDRQKLREEKSRPLMKELREHIDQLSYRAIPKSPLGKAVSYALHQWDTLTVFLSDGALAVDNNLTEQRIRPVALGRRNFLFAGNDAGAHRLATLYTLMGSCDLAGIVDPWAYLRDVLDKLSRDWPQSRIDELLPQQWKATRAGLAQ